MISFGSDSSLQAVEHAHRYPPTGTVAHNSVLKDVLVVVFIVIHVSSPYRRISPALEINLRPPLPPALDALRIVGRVVTPGGVVDRRLIDAEAGHAGHRIGKVVVAAGAMVDAVAAAAGGTPFQADQLRN